MLRVTGWGSLSELIKATGPRNIRGGGRQSLARPRARTTMWDSVYRAPRLGTPIDYVDVTGTERNAFVKLHPRVDLPLIAGPAGLQDSEKSFRQHLGGNILRLAVRLDQGHEPEVGNEQTGGGTLMPADAAAAGVAKNVLAAAAGRNAGIATKAVLLMACLASSLVRVIGVGPARAARAAPRRRAGAQGRCSTPVVAVCGAHGWAIRNAPPIQSHHAARQCPSAHNRRAAGARELRCVGEIRRRCFAPVG